MIGIPDLFHHAGPCNTDAPSRSRLRPTLSQIPQVSGLRRCLILVSLSLSVQLHSALRLLYILLTSRRGDRHGPPYLRRLSRFFSTRLTTWQTVVLTLIYLYITRNFGKLLGLECPEPLANLYTRSYFRATWITTALDAGFWSAMHIPRKWLRDICSIVFTLYYLICAEQADEKVRKVRAGLTLQHLRVSWDKPTTPYIAFISRMLRPRFTRYPPRQIRIPRPRASAYTEPINAWLYFDGPLSALKQHDKLVLDIPGGGFVAMTPRAHDDKLLAWAGKTGTPVLALDYRKAPEYPYPYALNECYDAYHSLHASRGRCIGLAGTAPPKIIVSGDSAGGNLATGLVLMILEAGSTDTRRWQGEATLPPPEGVVLIYPALDMNIGNWMTDEQMALIRERRVRGTNKGVLRRKSEDYRLLTPDTPAGSDVEDDDGAVRNGGGDRSGKGGSKRHSSKGGTGTSPNGSLAAPSGGVPGTSTLSTTPAPSAAHTTPITDTKPQPLRTRLAMSSMISYFNDRILTPEMMRAMIILYIGPHTRPDFSTDYLLSPLLAPEALLARFPRLCMLTGERDPLVDDTVIFAGRVRQAKGVRARERRELGLPLDGGGGGGEGKGLGDGEEWVKVVLVPGISHGFLQFGGIFPEGWRWIFRCARWMGEILREADARQAEREMEMDGDGDGEVAVEGHGAAVAVDGEDYFSQVRDGAEKGRERERHHRRMRTASSGDEDRPLEMSSLKAKGSPKRAAGATRRTNAKAKAANGRAMANGRAADGANGVRAGLERRRTKSLVSLASSDDLLGRRMKGLTGGLMGGEGVLETP